MAGLTVVSELDFTHAYQYSSKGMLLSIYYQIIYCRWDQFSLGNEILQFRWY